MYRNACYNPFNKSIFLRTWSEDGDRIDTEVPVTPYLYIEHPAANDAVSIFKTPLKRINFETNKARREYVERTGNSRLFHNLPVDQQYLIDTFRTVNNTEEFSKHPLKIFFLDLETHSPEKFPHPDKAEDPINLITIYDTLSGTFHTWGLQEEYTPSLPNHVYIRCLNELVLLEKFVNFWAADYPDIMSGWNSEFFDLPYIINRITNLLGKEMAERLSPVGRISSRDVFGQFGRQQTKWTISGLSCIDYMEIYKTFVPGQKESFSLNYIAKLELDEGKTSFNATNLSQLALENWKLFVDYNVQDVHLLVKLDAKLKLLKVVRLLAYKGCTNFESSLGKVAIVAGAVSIEAAKQGMILSTFRHDENVAEYQGGYVKDPERGLHKAMVTFDVNSLYPNTIITLNISPETKVGKIIDKSDSLMSALGGNGDDQTVTVRMVNGKVQTISKKVLRAWMKKEKLALSKAGVLYSQKARGVLPSFIDSLYKERVAAKTEMLKLKKLKKPTPEIKESIEYLNTLQGAVLKILLNSAYGVTANKYSPLVDTDHASSITETGQEVAKAGAAILDQTIRSKYGIKPAFTTVAQDTDSVMITIQPVLEQLQISLLDVDGNITPEAHQVVNFLEEKVNTGVNEWAVKELNTQDSRYVFKREAIADVGLFLMKKRYILHILDNEGVVGEKFKYVGIELVRSTTPAPVKVFMKEVIDSAMLTRDIHGVSKTYIDSMERFKALPIDDIALRSTANNLEKFQAGTGLNKFNKGTPAHIKAALAYNMLLNELKLEGKYEKIHSGGKLKFFYAAKNRFNLDIVGYVSELPKEFDIVPDYEKMFGRLMTQPIERVYAAMGWKLPSATLQIQTDLFDMFSLD